MNLSIHNARVICPSTGLDQTAHVHIKQGRIAAINLDTPKADNIIDGSGCVLAPGLVDVSVRLREPGYEHKGALETELKAAVAGGVTTVVCPPDTDPVLDEPGLVEMIRRRADSVALSHVLPLGALTLGLKGEALTEMAELTKAGCIGFSQGHTPIVDTQVLIRALSYARSFNYPVWLRPSDARLMGGVAASGAFATRMGLSGVSVAAESIALLTLFELLRSNPARVHLQCVASARGVDLIRAAKAEGLPITCDVSAYHLHFCDTDIGYFNPNMRFDPPLRSSKDRDALHQGLLDGTIDAICSDHTPVDADEKLLPFAQAAAGASGVELLLSLGLLWATHSKASLPFMLSKLTTGPAHVMGHSAPRIAVGEPADLVLFNPTHWQTATHLKSQGQNSPCIGMELPGQVLATFVNGALVYQHRN